MMLGLSRKEDPIQAFATFEHLWPDGSAAVSVHHNRLGWLEFDVLGKVLPEGVQPRDQFEVRLHLDRAGNVVRHQVPPGARVMHPTEPSVGSQLSARIPPAPKDWNNPEEVAKYEKAMDEWERKSALGRRGAQDE